MTEDLGHMEFLEAVAGGDVRALRKKEASYGSSWKRRGGVGAFMMMARKWDRLEVMLAKSNAIMGKYDIFEHIETAPHGEDGTVLAEVRDLRRYLMLIEAEMMARGAVAKPEDTVFKGPNYVELTEITRQAFRSALVGRDEAGVTDPNPPIISTLIGRPSAERCVPRYGGAPLPEPAGPGTPDDGGHHEPRAGRGVQALTASLVAGTYDDWPANVIISTTDPVKQGADSLHWVLDRRLWPRAEVDGFFLALPRQCSAAEFADLPPEYRGLYGADGEGDWVMRGEFVAAFGK